MEFDTWTVVASAAVSAIVSLVAVRAQTFRAGRAEHELAARHTIDALLRNARREVLLHERSQRGRPPRVPGTGKGDDGQLAFDLLAAAEAFGPLHRAVFRHHVRIVIGPVWVRAAEVYDREVLTLGAQLDVVRTGESIADGLLQRGLSSPGDARIVRTLRRHLWRLSRSY
ncbi:hypothetical protein NY551_18960 [Curtobacterium flaccumfaciens pv. oortii]|uniref:hypothetical protein n=1 Tax=Curtobacterium flaccumfaciens TaxID=2035 RepID=UPI00265A9234|nr:hypothetical protein [Curtobacterium flaccumfaciens]MCS5524821.1 hypothetical protein [Curtobacterium flaccumfaciens pv. oortii]